MNGPVPAEPRVRGSTETMGQPAPAQVHSRDARGEVNRFSCCGHQHAVAGALLHPTSLPGRYGIGDLGPAARSWVDALARARQSWWQILPLGPTGFADSPYQCFSAFAGNPLLIDLDAELKPRAARYLDETRAEKLPPLPG